MDISELFLADIMREEEHFRSSDARLVHYTSTRALLSMLEKKEAWLRNTTLMNDYQEIERGIAAVVRHFDPGQKSSDNFWKSLDDVHDDISKEIQTKYNENLNDLRYNTFVMSLSLHTKDEDQFGLLSMWRAYAKKDGVAIVLKSDSFLGEENTFNVFSYPVLYWENEKIKRRFEKIKQNLAENKNGGCPR